MNKKQRITDLEDEVRVLGAKVQELMLRIEELESRPFATYPPQLWYPPSPWIIPQGPMCTTHGLLTTTRD